MTKEYTEQEFLKEHPSLKGKRINVPDCQKCNEGLAFLSNVIHETQLDKAKVKEVVSKNGRHEGSDEVVEPICLRILNELGL